MTDELKIYTAKSHLSEKWQVQTFSDFSLFAQKFGIPERKKITFQEYQKLSNDAKATVKNGTCYVGGTLKGVTRKVSEVLTRTLITVDIDYPCDGFLDLLCEGLQGLNYLVHTTFSHTPDKPRYRVLIPLRDAVTCERYHNVLSGFFALVPSLVSSFDLTSFEVNRLMYFPSCTSDGEYFCKVFEGIPFDGNAYLTHPLHAVLSKRNAINNNKLAENPTQKNGVIGAFCRAYSIENAIELFLSDVYKPTTQSDRYTYVNGTSSGGVVLYDGLFAYSHHNTDPCSQILCNAFDLVRLHRFGFVGDDKTSNELMFAFALKDKYVQIELAEEKKRLSMTVFDETISQNGEALIGNLDKSENETWLKKLIVDRNKGVPAPCSANLGLIFDNDENLKNLFAYNEFDDKLYLTRKPLWRTLDGVRAVRNVDYSGLRHYVDCVYRIALSEKINDTLTLAAHSNKFHPVRDYLNGVTWDGTPRVETLLTEYFGAANTLYNRTAVKKTLVGACARVFEPACKFDLVLTLVGGQGSGKSTFVQKLGGEWATDTLTTIKGKDGFEQIKGYWLVEIAELAAFRGSENDNIKHFLSKQRDNYRVAYGRVTECFDRQCVFIANTNRMDFLTDPTGNRRYLPVAIPKKSGIKNIHDIKQSEIDQIWAEAFTLYKNGEPLMLDDDLESEAENIRVGHYKIDEKRGIIERYLDTLLPTTWGSMDIETRRLYLSNANAIKNKGKVSRTEVCVAEVWVECFERPYSELDRNKTRDLNDIMRTLEGWDSEQLPTKTYSLYGRQRTYLRI